jgi:hypothetical protein
MCRCPAPDFDRTGCPACSTAEELIMTRPTTGFDASAASPTVSARPHAWTLPQHRARPCWINDTRTAPDNPRQLTARVLPVNGTRPGHAVVDATVVERLVRDAVERHCSALVADVSTESLGGVFAAPVRRRAHRRQRRGPVAGMAHLRLWLAVAVGWA